MTRAVNSSEPTGAEAGPFGAEFQAAVRTELEAMLLTPIFVQSGRCKRFLNYIVDQTLAGMQVSSRNARSGSPSLSVRTTTTRAMIRSFE